MQELQPHESAPSCPRVEAATRSRGGDALTGRMAFAFRSRIALQHPQLSSIFFGFVHLFSECTIEHLKKMSPAKDEIMTGQDPRQGTPTRAHFQPPDSFLSRDPGAARAASRSEEDRFQRGKCPCSSDEDNGTEPKEPARWTIVETRVWKIHASVGKIWPAPRVEPAMACLKRDMQPHQGAKKPLEFAKTDTIISAVMPMMYVFGSATVMPPADGGGVVLYVVGGV